MKKSLNYILIAAVILVWALIITKVVDAFDSGDEPVILKQQVKREVYNDFALPKDTLSLLLNYRDPFGLTTAKDSVTVNPVKKSLKIMPAPRRANLSFIQYSGYIKNPGSNKLLAMMKIKNQEIIMSEGQTAEGIKLIRNMKDSLHIKFNGELRFIRLNASNQ